MDTIEQNDLEYIVFSPLVQGMLTNKYPKDIPKNSRALKDQIYLDTNQVQENIKNPRTCRNHY